MASAARAAVDAAAGAFRALAFDRRMAAGLFAAMALLPPLSPLLGDSYLLLVGERVLIFAIAALSLELLIGAGGLVSFGHAAFLGIGAYAAGIAASHGLGTLAFALPAALAASALFALLTGAIAVRTRGVYFIMITLAFGQMAFFVAASLAPYGGDDGLSWPGRTLVFGTRVLENRVVFFYATLALAAASYLLVSRLVASRFGRVLRGLTDSETRMQAIGFAPYRFRLTAYVVAGTLCGLAGFLLGNQAEFVSPAYMHWQRSGELIVMVLLGGTGTLYGPVALLVLEETLARLTEHWKAILGLLLVLVVLFARGGIAGAIEAWRQRRVTPVQLLAGLQGHVRTAMVRIEHFAQAAIAAARQFGRRAETKVGAGWLRWQAVLRPRLDAFAALAAHGAAVAGRGAVQLGARAELSIGTMNRTLASLAGAADRGLTAGLGHCVRCWQAVLRPRLDSLVALSRRGVARIAARAGPWKVALHRALKSAAGSTVQGISAALERWRRR
jgi:branched-chain amino acid transport system permease protein